jgi:hypothetical protein
MNVGIIAITIKSKAPRNSVYNLPNTQWFVSNNSNVPCFFHPKNYASLLRESRISKPGAKVKNGSNQKNRYSEYYISPSKTQRNNLIIRKMG